MHRVYEIMYVIMFALIILIMIRYHTLLSYLLSYLKIVPVKNVYCEVRFSNLRLRSVG